MRYTRMHPRKSMLRRDSRIPHALRRYVRSNMAVRLAAIHATGPCRDPLGCDGRDYRPPTARGRIRVADAVRIGAIASVLLAVAVAGASRSAIPDATPACDPGDRGPTVLVISSHGCVGPIAEDHPAVSRAMAAAIAILPGSHPFYGPRPWGAVAGARRDGCRVGVAFASDGRVIRPFGPLYGCDR